MDIGPMELMIVLLIALLIFGGAKLPKLAKSMGEAAHEFRKGVRGHDEDDEVPARAEDAPTDAPADEAEPRAS